MPGSDSLFCFTSNKIDSHFCPNCRAPMLVRAGQDLSARIFECFNCDKVEVIPADRPELALFERRSWDTTQSACENTMTPSRSPTTK